MPLFYYREGGENLWVTLKEGPWARQAPVGLGLGTKGLERWVLLGFLSVVLIPM